MKAQMNNLGVKTLQLLNWVFFVVMIAANYLAVALPLNHKTTGQLSDQYPNLFVPAPLTFSIWGVIYLLLFWFCVKQSKSMFQRNVDPATGETVKSIGLGFVTSCFLNASWICLWHFEYIAISVVVMVLLLAQLVQINRKIDGIAPALTLGSRVALKAPFGVYLGWICIATIANVTAYLVSWGWTGNEVSWASTMVVIGAIVTGIALNLLRNGYLSLSVLWAFTGILIARHQAAEYHRILVWATVFAMLLVVGALAVELLRSLFRKTIIRPFPPQQRTYISQVETSR